MSIIIFLMVISGGIEPRTKVAQTKALTNETTRTRVVSLPAKWCINYPQINAASDILPREYD